MRAIGHALVAILLFARHVHLAPARTRGKDERLGLQRSAIGELDLVIATSD